MVRNSYTRVTLALDIIRKLEDGPFRGYHELGIIKHQIDLHDVISIENASSTRIMCNDPAVPLDNNNICWRAVELLRKEFAIDKHVRVGIEKRIPVKGGLAGGSANAATTLLMLNDLWNLGLNRDRLMSLGRKLGMDVPFYFVGGTAFDSETTGFPRPVNTDLEFVFVLAIPDFGVATSDAYRGIDYSVTGRGCERTENLKVSLEGNNRIGALECMHNDFELTVFKAFPGLVEIKEKLLMSGCKQVVMSGSGSTIIGIADNYRKAEDVCGMVDFKTIVSSTLNRGIS